MNKILLYFHTLKHAKFIQLFFQVYYKFFGSFIKPNLKKTCPAASSIRFNRAIINDNSFTAPTHFKFLNLEQEFKTIDWNFSDFGKLWTYNLNYFDFLQQENISKAEGLQLIKSFCEAKESHLDAYEPYPISLRGMNWVKFLSQHTVDESSINQQLYNDYKRLSSQIEYHILANHLIENGFSLLFGAYYFKDEKLYKKAKNILKKELKEQILADGAHYELTPMYHCIILHRVLDAYNLVSNNNWKNNELAALLFEKASIMLGWLKAIQFSNGELPKVNDTTTGIAPTPKALFEYAERLNIDITPIQLKESGYRKIVNKHFEILFDVSQIAPSYQPGHSHADSLQILLHVDQKPIIVDTGISTYEKNERRQLERSTISHNTVTVNQQNSSQVWSGFRVAKRAKVKTLQDNKDTIDARHNGYRDLGIICQRTVQASEGNISITDTVTGAKEKDIVQGHLHLHPSVNCRLKNNVVYLNENTELYFPANTSIEVLDYQYCKGYNQLIPAKKICYSFSDKITFTVKHS